MSDNLSIFVTMIVLVILVVIFPLYNHFERQDNMSYNLVLKATTNFVDEVINCGYIDQEMYTRYVSQIANTGNLYDIQLEAHKKIITKDTEGTDQYQDQYIIDYNDDIFDESTGQAISQLDDKSIKNGVYKLDIGDQIYIKVKNSSTTMAEAMFRNIVPTATSKNITVNYGGIIKNNAWLKAENSIIAKELIELTFKSKGLEVVKYQEYLYFGENNVEFEIKLDDPNVPGYVFEGWRNSEDSTSTIYKYGDKITLKKSMTLEAVFTSNTPTVIFKSNIDDVLDPNPNSKTVTYGDTYGTLPTLTKDGYTFDGWYTSRNGGVKIIESTTVENTSDHTLYAHWITNSYNITYNLNGGTNNNANPSTYEFNTTVTLQNPTKDGYIFDGWYSDSSFTTKVTKIEGSGDKTVYAKWISEITVTLDANGGSYYIGANIKVIQGQKYSGLATVSNPSRENCTFAGWYTAADGGTKVTSNTTVTDNTNHTLYAHWTPNTGYKITKHNFQGKTYNVMREYYGNMVIDTSYSGEVKNNTVYTYIKSEPKNGKLYYKIGDNQYILAEAFQ